MENKTFIFVMPTEMHNYLRWKGGKKGKAYVVRETLRDIMESDKDYQKLLQLFK